MSKNALNQWELTCRHPVASGSCEILKLELGVFVNVQAAVGVEIEFNTENTEIYHYR